MSNEPNSNLSDEDIDNISSGENPEDNQLGMADPNAEQTDDPEPKDTAAENLEDATNVERSETGEFEPTDEATVEDFSAGAVEDTGDREATELDPQSVIQRDRSQAGPVEEQLKSEPVATDSDGNPVEDTGDYYEADTGDDSESDLSDLTEEEQGES